MDDKKQFLREKMYSLHLFAAKMIVTLSSSALVLSIGARTSFGEREVINASGALIAGWIYLLLSIFLVLTAIVKGIDVTYMYYNNIIKQKEEVDDDTRKIEQSVWEFLLDAIATFFLGTGSILVFIYCNL